MIMSFLELTYAGLVNTLKYIPGVQGVDDAPYSLALIPDELKMQKLCEKSVEDDPWSMAYVPDNLKTQEMCKKAVEEDTNMLKYLPDQ